MKKRTIIATIAVALIAGISILVACTKEEKTNNITPNNKDLCTDLNMSPGELHNILLRNNLYHEFYGTAPEYSYLQQDYLYLQSMGLLASVTLDEFASGIGANVVDEDVSLYEIVLEDATTNQYSDDFISLSYKLNRAGTIIDIDSFVTYMYNMQDTINMNDELSTNERYIMNGAVSIAIKSAIFWEYEYPLITDTLVARARRSQCTNCNCFIDRDPNFTCAENARVRWADVKGWFRNNNNDRCISAKSASRQKHQDIIFEHGEGYEQGD